MYLMLRNDFTNRYRIINQEKIEFQEYFDPIIEDKKIKIYEKDGIYKEKNNYEIQRYNQYYICAESPKIVDFINVGDLVKIHNHYTGRSEIRTIVQDHQLTGTNPIFILAIYVLHDKDYICVWERDSE